MKKKIDELLRVARARQSSLWETCLAVWEFISQKESAEREEYFILFMKQVGIEEVAPENIQQYLSKELLTHINSDIGSLEERVVDNLLRQKPEEDVFYQKLYEKICDSSLLPDLDAQVAYFACLWLDPRIPYFFLDDGYMMSNEEYADIRQEIMPALKKADFVLVYPFRQKTQRASHLMAVADSLADERQKTVYWANVIAHIMSGLRPRKTSEHSAGTPSGQETEPEDE